MKILQMPKQMEMSTLIPQRCLRMDSHSEEAANLEDLDKVFMAMAMVMVLMAMVLMTTHMFLMTTHMAPEDLTAMVPEEDSVEEEDIKKPSNKPSRPSLEKEFQLAKANLKLPQIPIIQPTIGEKP